jgi:hypothetical protein
MVMDDKALQVLLDNTDSHHGVVGAQLAIFDGARLREFATGRRDQELDLPATTRDAVPDWLHHPRERRNAGD